MKRDNVNYILVGGFVVLAFVVLLTALTMITGRGGASADYHTYYHNVTGLHYGAPVFYQGYRIGQVSDLTPERTAKGTRYKVTLAVQRDWTIPKDSVARLAATGLLSDVAVAIDEGPSPEKVAVGGELMGAESADIFTAMNALAAQLSDLTRSQITPLIQTLSQRVDSITGSIDKKTPEILDQTQQLLSRLNTASDSVNDLLKPQNRAAVAGILGDIRGVSKELHTTQDLLNQALLQIGAIAQENRPGVKQSVDDLQTILSTLSGRIGSMTQHLDAASRNFDEFSHEIRKSPNRLLLAPKADKVEEDKQ